MKSNGITHRAHGLGSILIIDDEEHISSLLKFNLENEGYDIVVEPFAQEAATKDLTDFRLMLVDAMSQPFTGRDFLRYVKAQPLTAHIPVIILSHSDSEDDIISAFGDGADDYILKPFSLRELVARVKSVLRRNPVVDRSGLHSAIITMGPLNIDLTTRTAQCNHETLSLTKTEFAILSLLAKNRNSFFNRQQIYNEVWPDSDKAETSRIVDTNICRLRKKLGAASNMLVNKSGLGYSLEG